MTYDFMLMPGSGGGGGGGGAEACRCIGDRCGGALKGGGGVQLVGRPTYDCGCGIAGAMGRSRRWVWGCVWGRGS